mmetsp:Transcript_18988/g.60251  ORF Transcript_18988/g.60251 Transcript_18988/m.60251 type:complete len:255 (+) Transcript_18988:981-1745(+)
MRLSPHARSWGSGSLAAVPLHRTPLGQVGLRWDVSRANGPARRGRAAALQSLTQAQALPFMAVRVISYSPLWAGSLLCQESLIEYRMHQPLRACPNLACLRERCTSTSMCALAVAWTAPLTWMVRALLTKTHRSCRSLQTGRTWWDPSTCALQALPPHCISCRPPCAPSSLHRAVVLRSQLRARTSNCQPGLITLSPSLPVLLIHTRPESKGRIHVMPLQPINLRAHPHVEKCIILHHHPMPTCRGRMAQPGSL